MRAERHLILDTVDVTIKGCTIQFVAQPIERGGQPPGQQLGRRTPENAPAGRGQPNAQPDRHPAVGHDLDRGALQHLLTHGRDFQQAALSGADSARPCIVRAGPATVRAPAGRGQPVQQRAMQKIRAGPACVTACASPGG